MAMQVYPPLLEGTMVFRTLGHAELFSYLGPGATSTCTPGCTTLSTYRKVQMFSTLRNFSQPCHPTHIPMSQGDPSPSKE
ncbi:hypothetical protein NDU88_002398, partial [Pleurodeles waltl]